MNADISFLLNTPRLLSSGVKISAGVVCTELSDFVGCDKVSRGLQSIVIRHCAS